MDEAEFSKVYWYLHHRLMPFAVLRVGYNDAQDAVAETMHIVWERNFPIPKTEEEQLTVFAFAFSTLRNKINNIYRFRAREHESTVEWSDSIAYSISPQSTVDDYAEAFALLRQLNDNDQTILILRYVGYRPKQIADILDCSETTARQRLSRASKRVQALRNKQNREEDDHEK